MKLKLLIGMLAVSVGLGANAAKTTKLSNDVLKIGMTQEFENLNPLVASMLATTYINGMVSRSLISLDAKGKWVPMLATAVPSIENGLAKKITVDGKEKMVSTWEIKANAKWGDGTPVTGHDVVFTWQTGKNPNVSVPEKKTYTQVEKIVVDKANPKKFTMHHEKAEWDFFRRSSWSLVPKHLEASIISKYGKEPNSYDKNSNYTKNPTNPGLYNGPYIVIDLKLSSHVTLAPNPHFYGKKPNIQKVVLKLIPNTGTLEANLRSGTIDMISVLGFTFDQAVAFEKKAQKQAWPYKTNFKQSLVYEHIDLNLENPILADINVRKALVHAIDRKKLTKALFDGRQPPAIHNVAPIDPWFTKNPKDVVLYNTSKRKARKMLEAAGWKMGKDGFRYKDGKKLTLPLMTTAGNKTRELVQVFLQKEWKSVGVDVPLKNEPPRVYFGETVRKGQYEAMAMYAWISTPENSPRGTFHSSNIPTKANGFSGQNSGKWKNSLVDELLDDLDVEFSAANRKNIVGKILREYTNDVPVIPLYYRSDVAVTPNSLKGFELTGHNTTDSNFVEFWSL